MAARDLRGAFATIPEARSGDLELDGGPGIQRLSDQAGHAQSASGFSGLADGARPLTPYVMFYKLAPKYRAYVRLTQIREFADVTGELDDNFQ